MLVPETVYKVRRFVDPTPQHPCTAHRVRVLSVDGGRCTAHLVPDAGGSCPFRRFGLSPFVFNVADLAPDEGEAATQPEAQPETVQVDGAAFDGQPDYLRAFAVALV